MERKVIMRALFVSLWVIVILVPFLFGTATVALSAGTLDIRIVEHIVINAIDCREVIHGQLDERTGAYSLVTPDPQRGIACAPQVEARICPSDITLARWLGQIGLDYLVEAGGQSLFRAARGNLKFKVNGVPKRDPKGTMNRLAGTVTVRTAGRPDAVELLVEGEVRTASQPCRSLAPDRHSVTRLGIKPATQPFKGGTFVGGGNFDFDPADGDPEAVGGVDFWNLEGTFTVAAPAKATPGDVASINRSHMMSMGGVSLLSGEVGNIRSSTVTTRGVFTFSGAALADDKIHKHNSIANLTGGGLFLGHFDVPVKAGEGPEVIAGRTADLINRSSFGFRGGGRLLAVQGTEGVGRPRPDPKSPSVAVCQTADGVSCVSPDDQKAQLVFRQIGTQLFSSAQTAAGVSETFGILGPYPLVGWLTPFKTIIATDVRETGLRAAGGSVTVAVNICQSSSFGTCDRDTVTNKPPIVVPTATGQTSEEIARIITRELVRQGVACIQRIASEIYMDAGPEMPSTLTVGTTDKGVRMMGAAADVVSFVDPH